MMSDQPSEQQERWTMGVCDECGYTETSEQVLCGNCSFPMRWIKVIPADRERALEAEVRQLRDDFHVAVNREIQRFEAENRALVEALERIADENEFRQLADLMQAREIARAALSRPDDPMMPKHPMRDYAAQRKDNG